MSSHQDSHNILWNTFKKGDWEAYTSLYHLYYRLLNNYGYKFTRDVNLIEDAIHDLFVRLWTNRNNLGEPLSVKNYLYKSLRNILFRKLRTQSRFFTIQEDEESIPFEVSYDNQLILNEEEQMLQDTIKKVLHKLPARQQEIIYLRFYDGLSYEEIADIMAIHVNSAYKLLYKALESVQQSLSLLSIATVEIIMRTVFSSSTSSERYTQAHAFIQIPISSLADQA
ncbi:RNA polymerase sigma factor [Ohtaekwangia koreensis]|uniref:RNA polymerase sigma factor, sigma-70 family n=1 Tax=Ohtaekwangia koreensis TaxID=688867 RepID=A0A1T5JGE9_9BACT|nr:sigma-70 family RNA polymerase sigma factor [Ohtaekwangia koreensis]SKC50519.1 RNA polymerase sigma factor, sigma-70 family [Ohtaekwangia koreensis]